MPENYDDQTYYGGYLSPAQITATPSTREGKRALRKTQNLADILTIRNGGPQAQKALIDYIHRGTNQFARDFGSVLGAQAFLLSGAGLYPKIVDFSSKLPLEDLGPQDFLEAYYLTLPTIWGEHESGREKKSEERAKEQANGIYKVHEEGVTKRLISRKNKNK